MALLPPGTHNKHTTFLGFIPRCMRSRKRAELENRHHTVLVGQTSWV